MIGSGAGGAATAAILAERGFDVLILEEGPQLDTSSVTTHSPGAIASLYRDGGLTPILGNNNIAFVEGRCVGGSTEVNSAFWHRLPADCYHRWATDAQLRDFSPEILEPYFVQLERELSVSYLDHQPIPRSSEVFRRGIQRMGWQYTEVPRCQKHDLSASPFAPGNKQSMQRTFLPRALAAGARLVSSCRAVQLRHRDGWVEAVDLELLGGGERTRTTLRADSIFVCGGAVQSAALLRRSGITRNVGNNLRLHPMIKAAALFDEPIGADREVLPIYQVKEFWPNLTIGGAVFTPGFLAMLLADNWAAESGAMHDWQNMALYYAAVRGMNRGTIRTVPGSLRGALVHYRLSEADRCNLSAGLAHLGELLFAAGAKKVFPALRGFPALLGPDACRGWLAQPLPLSAMSLSTVHVFSSCPMGENPDLCATDSFGKVTGFRNLNVNDASLLPDSPGVNPQGTIMAVALRNAERFAERHRMPRRGVRATAAPKPRILITGAPGWLGSRLLEVLRQGGEGIEPWPLEPTRCLVHPASQAMLAGEAIEEVAGDIADAEAARALCAGAEGAVLFHLAGVIHPRRRLSELERVNVTGTRNLLAAAAQAGVRRIVAVSSNSPFGFNRTADECFDESSPYRPYMGYGRSKQQMEELVQQAQVAGELETVIVRAPWFYGPHQPPRQTLFFQMIRQGRFPILGDGEQRRSMAYVDNLCQGLLRAAGSERAVGQSYWIADARPYSINEIVATVVQVLEQDFGMPCSKRQLHLPGLLSDAATVADGMLQRLGLYNQKIHVLSEMRHTIACRIDKAKAELNYDPAVELRGGMRASVRWCLAHGQRL